MRLIEKIITDEKYRDKLETLIIDSMFCPSYFHDVFKFDCEDIDCECRCETCWNREID